MKEWKEFILSQEKILGKSTIDKWLSSLKIIKFDACNLYLEAKDSFQITWFEEHIRPKIKKSLVNNNNHPIKVFISHSNFQKKEKKLKDIPISFEINEDVIQPHKKFSSFISEESNLMAYKLLNELTADDGISLASYNPIFLFGKKGVGKTHLLMATATALKEKELKTFYVSAQSFTDHVVQAIRLGHMKYFRQTYRQIDVLLVDDVDIFSNKNATQEEFFHTFNTLHTNSCQIILASDLPPTQLTGIEPRLISRFDWGISIKIEKLNEKSYKQAIYQKAKLFDLDFTDQQLDFFKINFPNNLEKIQQALEALVLRLHLNPINEELTSTRLEILLHDLIKKEEKIKLTPEILIKHIATHFDLSSEDILGKSQTKECVIPRQLAMFLCRNRLNLTYTKIGKIFQKDHSTVISSVKNISKELGSKKNKISFLLQEILQNFEKIL